MTYFRFTSFVRLMFFASTVVAQTASTVASDLASSSSLTLVQKAYGYYPNKAAAGVFVGLYAIAMSALFFRLYSHRAWWGLCLPIGTAFMTAGFAIRIVLPNHPNSLPTFLASQLFILLSPTAFLAFNYILYGHFVVKCIDRHHSLIEPERTARYFVLSDITTFLIQSTGGSFLTSSDPNRAKLGNYIITAGLGLQVLSFELFIFLVCYACWSLKKHGFKPFSAPWSMILKLLFFSSAFFLLRCIYRTTEFAQGLGKSYLTNHEVFFYVFDALPLFIGVTTYAICWPSQYLEPSGNVEAPSTRMAAIGESPALQVRCEA